MKTAYLLLAPLVAGSIVGCASLGVPAHQASDYLVCRSIFGSGVSDNERRTAEYERARRGLDCAPYVAAQQANRAADQASGNALMQQGWQMMQPRGAGAGFAPMPPPPRQQQCYTQAWAGGYRTVCN